MINPFPDVLDFDVKVRDRTTGANGAITAFSIGRYQSGVWVKGMDLNDRPYDTFIDVADIEICGD